MAVLTEQERTELSSIFQRDESRDRNTIAGIKSEVKILIDSLDDYLDANASAMNQAIPQPTRGLMTTKQKARALIYVVKQRFLQE